MEKITGCILVIKVGSSTLTEKHDDGSEKLDTASFKRLALQILSLREDGYKVVLVSSAAITAGMVEAGVAIRPDKNSSMPELQRLASIGWRHVLNSWSSAFAGQTIGEILLTQHELKLANERDEAIKVIDTLLRHGDIAVVNENDAISHEEIAFGDNDTLSATLAAQIAVSPLSAGATVKLIILSDINGVYADINDSTTLIKDINDTNSYIHMAGGAGTVNGTGGMLTKFKAAEIAKGAGVETWVANGRRENVIRDALRGKTGTHFTVG